MRAGRRAGVGKSRTRNLLALLTCLLAGPAWAGDAYLPNSDTTVLEVLPRGFVQRESELDSLRRQLADTPENEALAISLAQRYLALGGQTADPRFYGYAQAVLKPWWRSRSAPPEILMLRARLKEKNHAYQAALDDLDRVIEQNPRSAQAQLNRANILRVLGRYRLALQTCEQLGAYAGPINQSICSNPIKSLTGMAEQSLAELERLLPYVRTREPSLLPWILTSLAETAYALGQTAQAQGYFRRALLADQEDLYLKRSYADFLLDQDQPGKVLPLLQDSLQDNGILLRAAIAAQALGKTELAGEYRNQLENRFSELRLRGGQPHARYEARYALILENNPARALQLAQENWRAQKEIRDTRTLLEAALGAQKPQAAQPAIEFLDQHATQHVVLQALVEQLRAAHE